MKYLIMLSMALLAPSVLHAQLNGTYTIGGSTPDYATFNDALLDLETLGISGPVIFNVRDGLYSEQLAVGPIAGTNINDRVRFISESGDSSAVVLEHPGNNLLLDSAMYMDFVQLTFRATGTTLSRLVFVRYTTEHIVFESCVFDGFNTPSVFDSRLVEFSSVEANGNMTFRNNLFSSGAQGLFIYGDGSSVAAWNNLVEGNHFLEQRERALLCQTQADLTIQNNLIESSSNLYTGGMIFQWSNNNTHVLANRFNIEKGYGMKIWNCDGNSANPILLANNMVSNACFGTFNFGIFVENSDYVYSYYNSVNMHGNDPSSAAFRLSASFSDDNNRLKNNCLMNDANGVAIMVMGTQSFDESDHNNFYSSNSNLGLFDNVSQPDLAAWQSTTADDTNSVSMDPLYLSDLDLHLSSAVLNGLGIPVFGVDDDYDGDPRDLVMPDIGADEVDVNVAVEEQVDPDILYVYPNPTTGIVRFNTKGVDNITCSDIYGRSIQVTFGYDQDHLDLSTLMPGTYLLQIEWNNTTFVQRIVKQ